MSNASTFVNLPPPSDPVTPSDVPSRSGTPNSATTSMSELSTVAIKDGHRGHLPHHHSSAAHHGAASGLSHQLDAERADRISRLAGLSSLTTARHPQTPTNLTPGPAAPPAPSGYFGPGGLPSGPGGGGGGFGPGPAGGYAGIAHSYFDASGNPAMARERSTVGSASATGSVGLSTTAGTNWAGSEAGETNTSGGAFDKMSETHEHGPEEGGDVDADGDADMDASSVGGLSDEGAASLVAFGEGARTPARQSVLGAATPTPAPPARMIDGMTYDADVLDTTASGTRPPTSASGGAAAGFEAQQERMVRQNMDTTSADRMRRI